MLHFVRTHGTGLTPARHFSGQGRDVQIAQLAVGHRGRALGHEALALLGLGEGDDVADAGHSAQDGDQAIQPEGDPAMRGRSVAEGPQHIAEAFLDQGRGDLQDILKYLLLQVRLMDTDAAAAQFDAVQDKIVVLAADRLGVAVQLRDILGHR